MRESPLLIMDKLSLSCICCFYLTTTNCPRDGSQMVCIAFSEQTARLDLHRALITAIMHLTALSCTSPSLYFIFTVLYIYCTFLHCTLPALYFTCTVLYLHCTLSSLYFTFTLSCCTLLFHPRHGTSNLHPYLYTCNTLPFYHHTLHCTLYWTALALCYTAIGLSPLHNS